MEATVRTKLALGIAALWAFSYVIAVIRGNYTGVSAATPVMMLAAGYLLMTKGNGDGPVA